MANPTRIEGDVYINGNVNSLTMSIPAGSVIDASVGASANIAATKLEHRHQIVYAQGSAVDAADAAQVVHVCYGATGSVVAFEAGSVVAALGNDVCTVNLKKNGTSILNPTTGISLSSSATAYIASAGTISSAAIVDGDVLEVVIDATHGTGTLAKGVFASVVISEKAS